MQADMTGAVTHASHQAVDRARYEHTNPRWIESRFARATSQMRDRKNSRARGYDRYGNPNSTEHGERRFNERHQSTY
jgi:hypothetical protein